MANPEQGTRPRRGRPPNLRRRESILAAAEELFGRYGYEGTTMHQIAEACGIRDSLLYRYYNDKPAIFHAILERAIARSDQFLESLDERIDRSLTGREILVGLGRRYAGFVREMEPYYFLLLQTPELVQSHIERSKDLASLLYAKVDEIMRRALGDRVTEPHDIRLKTRVFLGAIFSYTLMSRRKATFDPTFSCEEYVEAVASIVWRATGPA